VISAAEVTPQVKALHPLVEILRQKIFGYEQKYEDAVAERTE
jgi:hypothetical protein